MCPTTFSDIFARHLLKTCAGLRFARLACPTHAAPMSGLSDAWGLRGLSLADQLFSITTPMYANMIRSIKGQKYNLSIFEAITKPLVKKPHMETKE